MPTPSVRTGVIVGVSIVLVLAGVAVLAAGYPAPAVTKAAAAPAAKPHLNPCDVCLERTPILDASKFDGWNDQDVAKAYRAAAKYPATIDLLHCFCECQESARFHHKSLLTCFTSDHGAGCGICQHEAIMAAKLKDQGASDEEVEYTVESVHKTEGHRPTKGRGL